MGISILFFAIAFGLTFGVLGVLSPKAPRVTIALVALVVGLITVAWVGSSIR
jgi:hypothetical protein